LATIGVSGAFDVWRRPFNCASQAVEKERMRHLGPREQVESALEAGERVLAWFEPDLNGELRFAAGTVALTDRRLLAAGGDSLQSIPLTEIKSLVYREQGAVGSLEALGAQKRLARWRCTARHSAAAERLVRQFDALSKQTNVAADAAGGRSVCPQCGAVLACGQPECASCAPAAPPPATRSLFRLTRFARPRIGWIALGFLLTLSSAACALVPPYLTMPLVDRVLIPLQSGEPVAFSVVGGYMLALAGAALAAFVLGWSRTAVMAYVSELISGDLRNATYSHLQRLSVEYFGGKRTGDLISRVGSDTDRICNFLSVTLLDFATDVLMIAMTAAVLLTIDPVLALCTLAPLPLIAWLVQSVRGRLRHGFARGSRAWAEMVNVLADTIPGIRVVKAFAQEAREIDRFHRANRRVLEANHRVNKVWSFFGPLVTLLTDGGLLVIWMCGALLVFRGHITVGVLTAFVAYITRFYTRLDSMSRMVASVQRAAAATHRIFEILDRSPSVPEPDAPVSLDRLQGRIELRKVTFSYGSRRVIHGVDLRIEPGEMIGLVGPSGAGKSTLINLICRFYDVAGGAILADGVDIRSYRVADYRRHIGMVLQDPFLFYGTVAENIAYGRPHVSRSEIVAAARAARAHEFILRLPDGYDSLVGERGQALSGGERQRISIARALLVDPRILILDEATSSVDTQTEVEIQQALDNLVRGRTTIVIAHRLSTLRRANRIVVVENGRVTEIGPHEELLQRSGAYARLHRAQLQLSQDLAV
jgi:ATP-binding cassette subfamily B protein